MQVNVHEAKTQLSKLIEAALRGEEVVIARDHKPVVRLVPVEARRAFRFGSLAHLAGTAPDFTPLLDEELDRWEREKEARIAAALVARTT